MMRSVAEVTERRDNVKDAGAGDTRREYKLSIKLISPVIRLSFSGSLFFSIYSTSLQIIAGHGRTL